MSSILLHYMLFLGPTLHFYIGLLPFFPINLSFDSQPQFSCLFLLETAARLSFFIYYINSHLF